MFTVPQATASNKQIASTLPKGLVTVFVGGTSGVGEYTLAALARYAIEPHIYIISRSEESATRIISECQKLNAGGKYDFIKADISLINTIENVCRDIKQKEKHINLLFQSQGGMAYGKKTSEGLPFTATLALHPRLRFIQNLFPLVRAAPALRRIVCVGAATCEGAIDTSNLMAEGFALMQKRDQIASMATLLIQEVAKQAPDVSFVHNVPGVVKSGIMRSAEGGLGLNIIIWISKLLSPFISTSPEDCAEQQLFMATSEMFPAKAGDVKVVGVPLTAGMEVARV